MKKTLLFASLLFSTVASAQMTLTNEPTIGENVTMYLCDSFALNLSGVTGSGVTWDYSSIAGYAGETRVVEVLDATTTAFASDYTGATKAISIGASMMTYFSSTATERSSQGFYFNEPSAGDVKVKLGTDEMLLVNYPFSYGSSLNDAYAGNTEFTFNMFPVNETLTGNIEAAIDGEGTLLLPNAVSLSNVLRYKSADTSYATIQLAGIDVEVIREQYEYYDYTVQNLPVFIHSTITMNQVGGGTLAQFSLVLSKYPTTGYVGINEVSNVTYSIAPNPATESITISGAFEGDANASIADQNGRQVMSSTVANGTVLSLEGLEAGIYFITVSNNGNVTTKKFVKK